MERGNVLLTIAICDDNTTDLQLMEKAVRRWTSQNSGIQVEVDLFERPEELLLRVQMGKHYSILILDILMPGINGIRLAKKLRTYDMESSLIYATASKEFALEAYENHALQYLVKPVEDDALFEVMNFIVRQNQMREELAIMVHQKEGVAKVLIRDLMYIENLSRVPVYHLTMLRCVEGLKIRGNFNQAITPIPTIKEFISPHQSFWVNMRYIYSITQNQIILENKEQIPISRNKYAAVRQKYLDYIAKEGGFIS